MTALTTVVIYIIGATVLAYARATLRVCAIAAGVLFVAYLVFGTRSLFLLFILLITAAVLILLSIDEIRIRHVTAPLFSWYRKILPPVSDSERVAIDAGTVWWEGELFKGNPDWEKLLASARTELTETERAFIDGPVEELCRMCNAWEISFRDADIPQNIVEYIKKNKFLGMIIPAEYGGLEMSPAAQVLAFTKIFSLGGVVGNFISVPNSLGPGELLVKYGTAEQKQYYLPRLANGEEIPCFALTAPLAGSDATSIPDTGIVSKGQWQDKEIIGMRLNINKRYITLAPIATLIGLAFKLKDPDHLIGDKEDYGITCALVPRDTAGLEIGRRHYPIGDPFSNGPIRGQDIFVPLDFIIGGRDMAGHGWRMLIECLSTGRAIVLPAISNSIAKNTLAATGAYARIRRQFGLPIAEFEGIQKPLARMAGFACIINAATMQTAHAISAGARPAVPASILKYHCTEMARQVINDGMDIQGGKAVMKGPKNTLSAAYESVPVATTVEGANILTRNLMIFGQGAIRCHPYVLKEMELAGKEENPSTIAAFDRILFAHAGNVYRNGAHAFVHALTGSLLCRGHRASPMHRYYRHITRLSAAFSMMADVAMLTMQSDLKKREMISARLGDLLSMLYLASMVLKNYQDQGSPRELKPVIEWSCRYLLSRYQDAMHELLNNLPSRPVAWKMRLVIFPLGRHFNLPSDRLEMEIAELVTHDTEARRKLIDGIYQGQADNSLLGRYLETLTLADRFKPLLDKLRKAVRNGAIPDLPGTELVDVAESAGLISEEEAAQLRDFDGKVMDIINVDDFDYHAFSRSG